MECEFVWFVVWLVCFLTRQKCHSAESLPVHYKLKQSLELPTFRWFLAISWDYSRSPALRDQVSCRNRMLWRGEFVALPPSIPVVLRLYPPKSPGIFMVILALMIMCNLFVFPSTSLYTKSSVLGLLKCYSGSY